MKGNIKHGSTYINSGKDKTIRIEADRLFASAHGGGKGIIAKWHQGMFWMMASFSILIVEGFTQLHRAGHIMYVLHDDH